MPYTPKTTHLNVMQQGADSFLWPSGWNDVVQSSAVAKSYDVTAARTAMGLTAGQALFVIFAADGPFWANFHDTAAIPSGDVANGSASEYSPNHRLVDKTITTISFISPASANVGLSFFIP